MSSNTSRTEIVVCTENNDNLVCMQSNYRAQASILCAAQTDDEFCDVKLFGASTDSSTANTLRPIHAHKVVLAYASKHLFDLFTSDDYTDSHQSEYKIENVDHDCLRLIVEFIYTGKLVAHKSNAGGVMRGVLIGAKYLLMPQLAEACETFLAGDAELNLNNCVSLWSFARKYSCLALMHATSTFIAEHLADMPRNAEFLSTPFRDCAKLLLSEAFIAAHADLRCSAAMAWLDCDDFDRVSHMHDILNMIPFTPGSVSASTILKANDCQLLQKNAPDLVRELMLGIFRRIDRNLPIVESSLPATRTWYVIGGFNCPKSFLSYDVSHGLWSELPSLSEDRQFFGACVVDNRLLTIGGLKNSDYAMDIDEYCFESKLWSSGQMKLRQSRTYLAVCRDGVYAYAIGGYIDYKFTNAVERTDLESNEIISLAGMHEPRSNPAAVVDPNSNNIYAVGGWGNPWVTSVEKYDISNNKWSQVGSLSVPRFGLAAVLSGDDLYTMGGCSDDANDCVEVFNVRTSQMHTAPSLLESRDGCRGTTINSGNVICVLGGHSSSTVECYDIREGKWSTGVIVPDMPERNNYFGFAAV